MLFIDTTSEYNYFKKEINKRFNQITKRGIFLFGPETDILEKTLPPIIGKKYGITVKNCTDAIMMVLKKVYHPGMVIILPNFGAYPTAVACKNITDQIYYVDVDNTLTINPLKLPNHIHNGIIIPVHLFGNNCDMPQIMEYALSNNHIVIEDCAQSTGSGSGSLGHYSVFSFYPTKPLASMGDGGMICTNEINDVEYFKKLRFYGQQDNYIYDVGINSRMDEFQCSIINSKIKDFSKLNEKRKEIAHRFRTIIQTIKDSECIYHQFVINCNDRKKVINKLNSYDIPYMIHYANHVSEIPSLQGLHNEVKFKVNKSIISLPCHPFLDENEIQRIEEFLANHRNLWKPF